jgi:undecaprenyl-diphosphatase
MLNNFFLNNFDSQIVTLFLNIRSSQGTAIFEVITFFGNWQFILPVILLIILWLFFKNKKAFIIPFALTVAGAEIATFLLKILFHRGRPLNSVFIETDFSFPSGHATIAITFYGYLAYLIIKSIKRKYNWLVITLAGLIIFFIGFSRLYLGVHYLSDVLAGYLVGALFLILGIRLTKK